MEISNELAIWALTTAGAVVAFFIFRLDRKLDKLETRVNGIREELISEIHESERRTSNQIRQFHDRVENMENDTIDMDRRLIVLETLRSEQRPRTDVIFPNIQTNPSPEYRSRRRSRRSPKE